jgi:crotonobetainyl-CoA:carnitine CoA-transferase CaiB-like acyl-CoA transferase
MSDPLSDVAWPLAGLSVLDLSALGSLAYAALPDDPPVATGGLAGAYAVKLLADAGADVLVVEPPGGDPLRRWSARDRADAAGGALHAFLRTSTRSVVVDPHTDAGLDRLRRLASDVNLVVEAFSPGAAARVGLDHGTLAAARPPVTVLSISPFGLDGPWAQRPATEFTLLAQAGSTATRGEPGRPNVNSAGRIGEWLTGVSGALAALASCRRAYETGRGAHIDLSMLETVTPTCTNLQTLWGSMSGIMTYRPTVEVPAIEPTLDGYVGFCIFTGQQWQDFCVLVDRPEWADDPQLSTMGGRVERGPELVDTIRAWSRTRTTAEICELAELLRIPVAPIGNGETVLRMEQFVERGAFVRNPGRDFLQPRVPYRISGHPSRPFTAAPELGADTASVDAAVDATAIVSPPVVSLHESVDVVSAHEQPLSGVRVLDCTAFWAGPYSGFALAGLGAEVLHIESIQRPDGMRFGSVRPSGTDQWWEFGPTFHAANAGKRSVTIDLTRPAGIELFRGLVERSDVMLENFSPRVMEQFGLTWDTLRSWNPQLVFVRMPAFGLDGPWRDRVGFAQTMEQISGMAWLTGYADLDPRNARGPCDPLAGLHAAYSAVVGLELVRRHGMGVHIEATMVETALNAAAEQVIEYTSSGTLLTRSGNRHWGAAPQGVYATADQPDGTTGELAVSVESDAQWNALVAVVDDASWHDPRLGTRADRAARFEDLDATLRAWCANQPLAATVDRLLAAGVPAAPVVGARVGDRNPQHEARRFYTPVEHSLAGVHAIPSVPWLLDGHDGPRVRGAAPLLGEHTRSVLGELLGLDDPALDALEADAIIGYRPIGQ